MLSYIGGKSRIAPKLIIPNIPNDIEEFVEVFGGMFWTFFSMDLKQYPNLKKIVYNDFNPLNYNLFKCIQNPEELLKAINDIECQQFGVEVTPPHLKELFISFQAEIFAEDFSVNPGDYVTAAKYVYILTQVFSGSKPEKSSYIDLKGKYKSKYLTFRDKLSKPDWVEHFLAITHVENMDFADVITKYDSPTTYFYVDPPYWKTENYYSNHDFDREDHERLADSLKSMKGKFSLSYYDFPLLSEWFPKDQYVWEMKQFAKAAAAKKGKAQTMGEELLIMNYPKI
jgi:DNA adenine methylase